MDARAHARRSCTHDLLFTQVGIKEAKSKAYKNYFTRGNGPLMFPLETEVSLNAASKAEEYTREAGGGEFTWQPYLICITVDMSDAAREEGGR